MTPKELSALPIGTEVLVRAKIRSNTVNSYGYVDTDYPFSNHVALDRIEGVAPPRPLKVGDAIHHVEATTGEAGKLVAIYGRHAVVLFPHNRDHGFEPLDEYVRAPVATPTSADDIRRFQPRGFA